MAAASRAASTLWEVTGTMENDLVHEDAPEFEEFVEKELKGLAERAQVARICLACLSDRLLLELVAGLVRSGASAADILNIVADGLDEAESDYADNGRRSRHMAAVRPHRSPAMAACMTACSFSHRCVRGRGNIPSSR